VPVGAALSPAKPAGQPTEGIDMQNPEYMQNCRREALEQSVGGQYHNVILALVYIGDVLTAILDSMGDDRSAVRETSISRVIEQGLSDIEVAVSKFLDRVAS
jgi:hypothetical protein